jgi:two-component system, OmpR family, sensor histidine kinase VicK
MTQNVIETVKDPCEIQSLTLHLIKSAREEILGIFSTSNAYYRQERTGALALSKEVAKLHNVRIRILTPFDDKINQMEQLSKDKIGFEIRAIAQPSQTKVSVLLVDRKFSLVIELKDDTKDNSLEAIGLATYSNSPATVLSYAAIFESLWLQMAGIREAKNSR